MSEVEISEYERVKELIKKKKKLMARIKQSRKAQIKARLEKKKVNEELRRLRGKKNLFADMAPARAQESVKKEIEAVKPAQVYPRDLEKRFDKIDKPKQPTDTDKVIDLGRIPEQPIAGGQRRTHEEDGDVAEVDEEAVGSFIGEEHGVVDFSED